MKSDVKPDDISKRMFIDVLDKAIARAGSYSALGRLVGTDHRNLSYWKSGRMPVYADMQKWYYILVDAGKEKGVK